jgi:hypothetical protein
MSSVLGIKENEQGHDDNLKEVTAPACVAVVSFKGSFHPCPVASPKNHRKGAVLS